MPFEFHLSTRWQSHATLRLFKWQHIVYSKILFVFLNMSIPKREYGRIVWTVLDGHVYFILANWCDTYTMLYMYCLTDNLDFLQFFDLL